MFKLVVTVSGTMPMVARIATYNIGGGHQYGSRHRSPGPKLVEPHGMADGGRSVPHLLDNALALWKRRREKRSNLI